MDNITIRKVTKADVSRLLEISSKTFHETFSVFNSEENMKLYMQDAFSTKKILAELDNKDSEFYFALLDDHLTGYLKINFGQAQTELQDGKAVEIERIYVLQEFQRKKIGQLLYKKALQAASERNVDYIWLGVWEQNTKAINFYAKNGFTPFDKHVFRLGSDTQTDIMMKLNLRSCLS